MKEAREFLMKNIPQGCYWTDMDHLVNTPVKYVLKAMEEYMESKKEKPINSGYPLLGEVPSDAECNAFLNELEYESEETFEEARAKNINWLHNFVVKHFA